MASPAGRSVANLRRTRVRGTSGDRMPAGNNFQHATYSRTDPGERVLYRDLAPGSLPDTPLWQEAMGHLGRDLAGAGVRVVQFLHGISLGTDLFGVQRLDEGAAKRGYSRGIPGVDSLLALIRQETNGLPAFAGNLNPPFPDEERIKHLYDKQVGDAGNFSTAYADKFRTAVNRTIETSAGAGRPILCSRILWSSAHHHLGRALGACIWLLAVRKLREDQHLGTGDRMLVQAHGQAGLVLALASNLLSPGASSGREAFFQVLKAYAEQRPQGKVNPEELDHLESGLKAGNFLNGAALDIVTYGTPVRYGWDPAGLGKLLHVVNHRPLRADGKRWLSKLEFPQVTMELPYVMGGDYVQQLAVAGTDALPSSPEAQAANRALWELLEPFDGFERWLECARKSVRCANDGLCLLVDYKDALAAPGNPLDHLFGHAPYTRLTAMLFNTREIVNTLYS